MPGSGRIAGPNRQNGLPVFEWAGHVGTANSVLEAADRHFLRINSYASPGDVLRDTNLSAAQKRDALRMAIRPRAVAIMRRLKADFQATRAAHTAMVVTRLRLLARLSC